MMNICGGCISGSLVEDAALLSSRRVSGSRASALSRPEATSTLQTSKRLLGTPRRLRQKLKAMFADFEGGDDMGAKLVTLGHNVFPGVPETRVRLPAMKQANPEPHTVKQPWNLTMPHTQPVVQ